jgi:hypothetical protein
MTAPITDPAAGSWERITSRGRLVWWRRPLGRHVYLAVSKRPDGVWTWTHRGPETDRASGYRAHAGGTARSSTTARKQADRYWASRTRAAQSPR